MLDRLRLLLQVTRSHGIARRYFVVNGFDGALTMLGLITGFYLSAAVEVHVVINACLGAAIALAMSGLSSAYISESAERRKELLELQQAMATDLDHTAHGWAARWTPILIAVVNGAAPLIISLVIITPLWLFQGGALKSLPPLETSIGVALAAIFMLGAFIGRISGTFMLWSGIKTLLVGLLTGVLIFLVEARL